MEAIRSAKNAFDKLIKVCAIISTISIVLIMLLNVIDTSFRWLEIPVYGVFELNGLLVGINIFLGLAYVQKQRKHVAVDVLGKYKSKWLKFIRSFMPLIVGMVFFGWLTYICGVRLLDAIETGEVIQGYVHFPLWPLKSAFFFGILLLTIQLVIDIILEISQWRHPSGGIMNETAKWRHPSVE